MQSIQATDAIALLYLPLEHIRQSVVPLKLLFPTGQEEHSWTNLSALPTQPDGHCSNPVHDVSSSLLVQPVKNDPGGTLTSTAPPPSPMALVPNGLHEIEPEKSCMYPVGHFLHPLVFCGVLEY